MDTSQAAAQMSHGRSTKAWQPGGFLPLVPSYHHSPTLRRAPFKVARHTLVPWGL